MDEEQKQENFFKKTYNTFVKVIKFAHSQKKSVKLIVVLLPSGIMLILSIVLIILIEEVWKKGYADFWRGMAWFTGIILLITISIWIITSNLKRSTKIIFILIPSGIISIAMIVVTIFGALVWSSGLATLGLGFIAVVSGLICIITTDMWIRARKKERDVVTNL